MQEKVSLVSMITGPYDLIVAVDFDDNHVLLDFVFNTVRKLPGVLNTTTCITYSTIDGSKDPS